VKSLENACHTWALLQWWFTTKRRYINQSINRLFVSDQWSISKKKKEID